MKIAIPVVKGKLSAHFGHADHFVFVEANPESAETVSAEMAMPPAHEPGVLPRWVQEQGANVIIAGGMGSRAQQLFAQQGIEVVVGVGEDSPEALALAYVKGTLQQGDNACDH